MSTLVGGLTGKMNTGIFWGDEHLLRADPSFLQLTLELCGFELWGVHVHTDFLQDGAANVFLSPIIVLTTFSLPTLFLYKNTVSNTYNV